VIEAHGSSFFLVTQTVTVVVSAAIELFKNVFKEQPPDSVARIFRMHVHRLNFRDGCHAGLFAVAPCRSPSENASNIVDGDKNGEIIFSEHIFPVGQSGFMCDPGDIAIRNDAAIRDHTRQCDSAPATAVAAAAEAHLPSTVKRTTA